MREKRKIRVLLAKPGLDGHDVGAKVVALALRDAGMEVIYSGLHRTVDDIVTTALQEDVNVIGLSILSGAHLPITQKLVSRLREEGVGYIPILVGGVIPREDIPTLKSYGAKGVFPLGSTLNEITEFVSKLVPNTKQWR